MKKPSSRIRDEIAKLQEQLRLAETREAERIGRLALKAGLSDLDIEEGELQVAFEDMAKRFRGGQAGSTGKKGRGASSSQTAPASASAPESSGGEA
jgi:hypothetical protein